MTNAGGGTGTETRRPGLGSMLRTDFRMYLRKILELVFRAQLQPSLGAIAGRVSFQAVDGDAVLRKVFPDADLGTLGQEARSLYLEGEEGTPSESLRRPLSYPVAAGMEDAHLDLIYKAVRLTRPARVVETGVANGRSSRAILTALRANGAGRLTSVDVASDVGVLIEPALRDRWDLVVLPGSGRREATRRCLLSRAPLDIFIHDSDHSYGWQSMEYRCAYAALRPGGLLISDDIDASFAFVDFVTRVPAVTFACVGSRKVMGMAVKPPVGSGSEPSPAP